MPSQYRQTIFVLRASCSPSDGRHASAPVDRAREHTSHRNPIRSLYWRSKARSPHWVSVAAFSPGHEPAPGAFPMRIGGTESKWLLPANRLGSGGYQRSGRRPRWHASFRYASLRVPPRRYLPATAWKDVQGESLRRGRTRERPRRKKEKKKGRRGLDIDP